MSVAQDQYGYMRQFEVSEETPKSSDQFPTRVKTRILRRNFQSNTAENYSSGGAKFAGDSVSERPNGSITVIGGPERGTTFNLTEEFSRIGRDHSQEIQLSEDDSVSRDSHAVIGFNSELRRFMVFDGGKVNPVWVNEKAVADSVFLENGDIVRIGETTLCLIYN